MKNVVDLAEYKKAKTRQPSKKNKKSVKKSKRRKLMPGRFVRFCFVVALILGGIYALMHTPLFDVKSVLVQGNQTVLPEKIIELAEIEEGINIFSLDLKECSKKVSLYPYVETATIKRKLPNKVVIKVVERVAVGVIVTSEGYIQVDETGIMLAFQPSLGNYNLPVISGIDLGEIPAPGQVIVNENFNQALKIIASCSPQLLSNIAELNVGEKDYVLAYTNQGVEIRLGDETNIEARMQDLNDILQEIVVKKIAEQDIQYIDMRYKGAPVIKMK